MRSSNDRHKKFAGSEGWRTLVTSAITVGLLGKAIAAYIGIAIYRWLS